MNPASAYCFIRSGRMQSEANMTVRFALPMGPLPAGGAADAGAAIVEKSTATRLNRTTGRSRREERVTEHLHDRRGTRSGAGVAVVVAGGLHQTTPDCSRGRLR